MFAQPHLNTRGGETGRILENYANARLWLFQILLALLVFRWGYVNTEKALYCLIIASKRCDFPLKRCFYFWIEERKEFSSALRIDYSDF